MCTRGEKYLFCGQVCAFIWFQIFALCGFERFFSAEYKQEKNYFFREAINRLVVDKNKLQLNFWALAVEFSRQILIIHLLPASQLPHKIILFIKLSNRVWWFFESLPFIAVLLVDARTFNVNFFIYYPAKLQSCALFPPFFFQESSSGNKLLVIYNKTILTSNCAVYKRFKLLTAVINNKFNKTSSNFML